MKTNLVKMALLVVLILTAILPNCAFAAPTYTMGGQSQSVNAYFNGTQSAPTYVIGDSQNNIGFGIYNGSTQNINQNTIVIGGNYGSAFQFILENRLRAMVVKLGLGVDGYQLTGTADLSYADKGFALGQSQGALGARWHKATVNVHLELVTGDSGYISDVTLSKTLDWNVAGITNQVAGNIGTGRQAAENEFLYQAGNKALIDLVSQIKSTQVKQSALLSPTPEVKQAPVIDPVKSISARIYGTIKLILPSGKISTIITPRTNPVGLKDEIWFMNKANQPIGKFLVIDLVIDSKSQTMTLKEIPGEPNTEPKNGDGFGFFYQN